MPAIPALLRGLAPVAGRQLPSSCQARPFTSGLRRGRARWAEADRRRPIVGPQAQRELPPQAVDPGRGDPRPRSPCGASGDRVDLAGAAARSTDAVRPEQSVGSFEPFAWRMNVRRIRARRRTARLEHTLSRGDAWPARSDASRRGPVVLGEHERGESTSRVSSTSRSRVDRPGIERGRPGLDVGDVLEPARERLEQLGLLARRSEEDPRLVHPRSDDEGTRSRSPSRPHPAGTLA